MKNTIDGLKDKWSKVGFGFTGPMFNKFVDIEELIFETLQECRNDERLFSSLVTWTIECGDMINVARLKTFITKEISSIAGCYLEISLKEGASDKLRHVLNKCVRTTKKEVFFHVMKKYKVTMDQEKERALPVFKKWGYYASGYNVKKDALRPRSWILKNNCNLGFRQIFGPNARAEILSFLVEKPKSYIQDISKKIKMSYPPVYYEIESMIKSGLVTCELIGRMKIISLPESSVRFLKAVPF